MLTPRLSQFDITFTLEGSDHTVQVWSDMSALEALRLATDREAFASKCESGICGRCEVLVNDTVTRVCSVSARRLDGMPVRRPWMEESK